MKTIIINASPRKNWNTALLLKEARKGAENSGAEVEYFDLYDLNFTGCRSCLACKRAGIEQPCKCYVKDDLAPVLESIFSADRLIIGSPIYFGQPTYGELRSLLERVCFPPLSYNDYSSIFPGKVDVDVFLTMNAPAEVYEKMYEKQMTEYFGAFHLLKGKINIIPVCDTLQVKDYSKYEMAGFPADHKKEVHDTRFPLDLEMAYKVGAGR